ncbi:MAG: hypothetical protein A3H91_11995 [Gammaproteobacteria bacterium RIFCSPLOWO2_02_FULL_61_13]|nr:MAG: hypothetical protein A3H91_11995 [Gammaproteobacteria bacterium RIFCSPLOWO2_02_FULL_61_13]
MNISFQVVAVPYDRFAPLFALSDPELVAQGARRMTVQEKPGYPCRASLADAEIGETVILLPFAHHDVSSPYRASGPIFIRKDAVTARPAVDEVPEMLRHRLLSIRAYDESATMIDADVVPGIELEGVIRRLFANERVRYLHIHNARPGCFNCRVVRA